MKPSELRNLFKSYMKVEDSTKAHAELSASGSERWLGCPASVSLSRGRPNIEHESAQVGTNAHTLLQFILENHNWKWLLGLPQADKFKLFIDYNTEQYAAVMVAVNFILRERQRMFRQTGVMPKMYIEQKIFLEGVGFGRSDVILYQPFGILHVIDYKNGKYKVDPTDNTQGLYYAVGAADKIGWDFSKAFITIIQPNAGHRDGAIRTWKTTPDRLVKAKLMFERGAKRTKLKNPAVIPNNKYCWFCPAKPVCPAHMQQKTDKILERFQRG